MKALTMNIKSSIRACFLTVISVGLVAISTNVSQAQGNNGYVPMWEIYGINPYHPQTAPARRISPMQSYSIPASNVPGCFGQNLLPGTTIYPQPVLGNSTLTPAFESESNVVGEADLGVTNASPSDIILNSEAEVEKPTLADKSILNKEGEASDASGDATKADSKLRMRLNKAEKELVQAKAQLEAATKKARVASERAYAAEKAAEAAGENSKRELDINKKSKLSLEQELEKVKTQTQSEVENQQKAIKKLQRQKSELEEMVSQAKESLKKSEEEDKEFQESLDQMEAKLKKAKAEQEKATESASSAMAQQKEKEKRLRSLRDEKAALENQNAAAKALVAEAEEKLGRKDEKLAELKEMIADLNAKRGKESAELKTAMASADEAEDLAKKLKFLEKEKSTLKDMAAQAIANVSKAQKDSKEKVLESKIFARWIPEKSFSSVLGVPEFCRNCSPHYVHKRCDRWDRLLVFPSFVLVFI